MCRTVPHPATRAATRSAVRGLLLCAALFPVAIVLGLTFTFGLVSCASWALTQTVLP